MLLLLGWCWRFFHRTGGLRKPLRLSQRLKNFVKIRSAGTGLAMDRAKNTGATGALSALTYSFTSLPQSYAFGLGGTLSSQAQRTDKFNSFYSVEYLMKDYGGENVCDYPPDLGPRSSSSPFLALSNLGIKKWLADAIYVDDILHSSTGSSDASFKGDSISYEIKFIVVQHPHGISFASRPTQGHHSLI
jgi:hypothetical protein